MNCSDVFSVSSLFQAEYNQPCPFEAVVPLTLMLGLTCVCTTLILCCYFAPRRGDFWGYVGLLFLPVGIGLAGFAGHLSVICHSPLPILGDNVTQTEGSGIRQIERMTGIHRDTLSQKDAPTLREQELFQSGLRKLSVEEANAIAKFYGADATPLREPSADRQETPDGN